VSENRLISLPVCIVLARDASIANLVHHLCGPLRSPRAPPPAFAGAAAYKLRHCREYTARIRDETAYLRSEAAGIRVQNVTTP